MKKPEFKMMQSLSTDREHSLVYRDDKLGLQVEVHTTVKKKYRNMPGHPDRFCKGRRYFFIDGDKRTFRNVKDLMKAYAKLKEMSDVDSKKDH